MGPAPGHVQADENPGNKEVDDFVNYVEEDGEQKTGAGIFYVELDAERRSAESDDGLRDSVEADGLVRERILQNADQAAGEESGERIAARGRETDHDQQRKIEDGEEREAQRHPRLQEDGGQRNEDRRRNAEAVDLNLLAGCVSDGHVSGERPGRGAAIWGRCPDP